MCTRTIHKSQRFCKHLTSQKVEKKMPMLRHTKFYLGWKSLHFIYLALIMLSIKSRNFQNKSETIFGKLKRNKRFQEETSSSGLKLVSPQEYATRLVASVACRVKTISLDSEALIKFATFCLASSNSSVALALDSERTYRSFQ